jgi:cell division initiation protein
MDSAAPIGSILDTLRTVEFRLNLKGYNVDEVDEYLEKAAVEAEALQEQVRQMTERLRQASDRIAELESEHRVVEPERPMPVQAPEPKVSDDALQRTLLMAQQFVDKLKSDSEAEAAELVSKAEERARTALAQAEEKARSLTTEAEQRLREEVTKLEGMRTQLGADIENMARHLEQERNRLRGSLTEVLKWVEDNVQPASSLMALRPRQGEPSRPAGGGSSSATPAVTPPRPAGAPPVSGTGTGGAGVNGAGPGAGGGGQVLDLRGPTPGGDRP